jgi:signal transduction histidine kinase
MKSIVEEVSIIDDIYKPIFFIRIFGLLTVGLVILVLSLFKELDFASQPVILILFPFVILSVIHWFIFIRGKVHSLKLLYLLLFIDIFVITAIIYFSGGTRSPLSFLYLIIVISAALISVRAVVTFGLATILFYSVISYIDDFGTSKFFGFQLDEITQIVMFSTFTIIIAIQSYYFISRIKSKNQKIMGLKDQFLFTTVHDIRSPATAIKWTLEKYKKPEFRERYGEIQEDIDLVEDLANRTLGLANNLLMLAKGQEVEIKKEPLDIVSVTNSVLKEAESSIIEKNIKVEYEITKDLPEVLANTDLLKEAIGNIVANAVKYNEQNGAITIKHIVENRFLRTTITNTGQRISTKDLEHLFTPYFRGDEEQKTQGTGLGLYITKRIVEQMGGMVGVESSSDRHTVFYVAIPLA